MGGPIKCKAALGGCSPLPSRPILAQESLHGSEEFGGGCGLWRALGSAPSGCAREEAALGWFKTKKSPSHGARSRSASGLSLRQARTKGELRTRANTEKRRKTKREGTRSRRASKDARESGGAAPRPS